MAEKKTLQQTAYDVGKGRVTSTHKMRAANAIVNAANGIMDYVVKGFEVADQFKEEDEVEQKAADSSIMDFINPYTDIELDKVVSSTPDTTVLDSTIADLNANYLDPQWLSEQTGQDLKRTQRFIEQYGQSITDQLNNRKALLTNQMNHASGMANIESAMNNAARASGSFDEFSNNYQQKYDSNGFETLDIGGNYDLSSERGRSNGAFSYFSIKIPEMVSDSMYTMGEQDTVDSILSEYDRIFDGVEMSEVGRDTVAKNRGALESQIRKEYTAKQNNELNNAKALNSVYQNNEFKFSQKNGGEKLSYEDVFNLINESNLDYNNPYHSPYIDAILADHGMSEEVLINEKLRTAIDSIDESYFFIDEYQGLGVYSDGVRVELPEDMSGLELDMDALLSGNYIRTGVQPLIDYLAEENEIEVGTDEYATLVETVVGMEASRIENKLEWNRIRIKNAYNSDMTNDEFLSMLSEMYFAGGISTEERNEWLSKIDKRQSIYKPHRDNAFAMMREYVGGLEIEDSVLKSRLNNVLFNSEDSEANLDREILSVSGSVETLRDMTQGEIEAYVNRKVESLSGEIFSMNMNRVITNAMTAITGKDYISYQTNILGNKDIMTIYTEAMNGMYPELYNKQAVDAGIGFLNASVAQSGSHQANPADLEYKGLKGLFGTPEGAESGPDVKAKDIFNEVTETIFGPTAKFSDLDDYQKNQVYMNSVIALVQSTMASDLDTVLTGGDKSIKFDAREVYIDGLGVGKMDSNGNVFVIDPSSYGKYYTTVLSFYYPPSSKEFKSVWGDGSTRMTIDITDRPMVTRRMGYDYASVKNKVASKHSDDPLVGFKSSLKISTPLLKDAVYRAELTALRGARYAKD